MVTLLPGKTLRVERFTRRRFKAATSGSDYSDGKDAVELPWLSVRRKSRDCANLPSSKTIYYWTGLYADVAKHGQVCEDCSITKSNPDLKGYSPGNVVFERPYQVVPIDFDIPLPVNRRGNTALLLFQYHFTGLVIAEAMRATGELEAAKPFEENTFVASEPSVSFVMTKIRG